MRLVVAMPWNWRVQKDHSISERDLVLRLTSLLKEDVKSIRTKQKETKHFNDIWHVNKSINKQLRKVSKEKGCEIINDWLKVCVNICIGVLKPLFLALRLSLLLNGSQLLNIWLANMKMTQILYLHHVPMCPS